MMESRDDDNMSNDDFHIEDGKNYSEMDDDDDDDVNISISEAGTIETRLVIDPSGSACTEDGNDNEWFPESTSAGTNLRRRTPAYYPLSPSKQTFSPPATKHKHSPMDYLEMLKHYMPTTQNHNQTESLSRLIYDEEEETEIDLTDGMFSEPEIEMTQSYSTDSSAVSATCTNPSQNGASSMNSPSSASSNSSNDVSFQKPIHLQSTSLNEQRNNNNTPRHKMSPGIRSKFQAPHRPPTKLHEICQQAQSVQDLMQARSVLLTLNLPRKDILGFASIRDGQDRTPMHLIAENANVPNDLVSETFKNRHTTMDGNNFFPSDFKKTTAFAATPSSALGMTQTTSFDEVVDPSRLANAERFIVDFLLTACPQACMSRDKQGKIPFEAALSSWVKQCYDEMLHSNNHRRRRKTMNIRRDSLAHAQEASQAVVQALTNAAKRTSQMLTSPDQPKQMPREKQQREAKKSTPAGTTRRSLLIDTDIASNSANNATTAQQRDESEKDAIARNKCFPIHVQLSVHVSFALKMLSKIIERLEKLSASTTRVAVRPQPTQQRQGSKNALIVPARSGSFHSLKVVDSFDVVMEESWAAGTGNECFEIKESIISSIASITDFVKMIFLIENDQQREYALSTTIVQRVLTSKYSVGGWLTAMLQNNEKLVSGRAVEYLKRVSDLSLPEKPVSNKINRTNSNLKRAERHQDELHDEISRLHDFVPSLLTLSEQGIEEAVTCMVVRRVMDRLISRPFCMVVIFCDALFLAMVLFGFRTAVNVLLTRGDQNKVMRGIYVANTGIFYFIIRELGKAISFCMITRRARDYLCSFWNLTDLAATLLALISVMCIRSTSRSEEGLDIIDMHVLRDLIAVTTGFLWLRVLNMLKGINMQMATYILAILQITKDTLSFGIILFIMVVAFGQMFYTILVPDFCSEKPSSDAHYACVQSEYIFRTYTILLGDFQTFDRDTFRTTMSLLIMIIYSFMVIIVLLNVLIALASDSYEKCLMKSQMLFGRARVMLIAELVCFQNILRKTTYHRNETIDISQSTMISFNDSSNPNNISSHSNNNKVYNKWWTVSFAKGWSRGSVLFFCLSSLVVFVWAVGEMAGYSSGERYGNVAASMGSILVNIFVFAAIMILLSRGADSISDAKSQAGNGGIGPTASTDSSSDRSSVRLPACLQNLMLRIMGSSMDTWNYILAGREQQQQIREQNEWRGRVHYLQHRMDQMAQISQELSVKQTHALEQLVAATELRLKSEMASMDHRVDDLRVDLLMQFKKSQEEMIKQIRECVTQGRP